MKLQQIANLLRVTEHNCKDAGAETARASLIASGNGVGLFVIVATPGKGFTNFVLEIATEFESKVEADLHLWAHFASIRAGRLVRKWLERPDHELWFPAKPICVLVDKEEEPSGETDQA